MIRRWMVCGVFTLAACSGGKPATLQNTQRATVTAQVQTINEAINSTHSAVQMAFATMSPAASAESSPAQIKVQKMASLIK